jgi:hypothetical protein
MNQKCTRRTTKTGSRAKAGARKMRLPCPKRDRPGSCTIDTKDVSPPNGSDYGSFFRYFHNRRGWQYVLAWCGRKLCSRQSAYPRTRNGFARRVPHLRPKHGAPRSCYATYNILALLLMRLVSRPKLQGDAMPSGQNPSRRFTSRVTGPSDLWVFWNCKKQDGLSRVFDLSAGGLSLSIEKSERMAVGEKVHLNFLTPEGQIRTDTIVRHVRPERLGLKFIAISEEDRTHLTALMTRLRNLSRLESHR